MLFIRYSEVSKHFSHTVY